MSSQFSLPLSLRDDTTFANFLATDAVREQVRNLLSTEPQADTSLFYLWGHSGSGISHVAQAVCHHYLQQKRTVQFLPLSELRGLDPALLLEGLEELSLTCVVGIQAVGGDLLWERALFNLYNKVVDRGNLMIATADCPPGQLPFQLPDLVSRLSSGLTFHLSPYSDGDKRTILQFRAAGLGIEITEEVAGYLLNRCSRQLSDMMAMLQKLDVASLEAKRRITIPFIKAHFNW